MKKLVVTVLTIILINILGVSVQAQAEQPIQIDPILPSNQDQGVTDYISVSSEGVEFNQNFKFKVKNNTEGSITITIKPTDALTSPNGTIQYKTTEDEQINSTILDPAYKFTRYVTHSGSITINSGEEKVVSINVNVPEIDGTLLGGIAFQLVQEGVIQKDESSGIEYRINNETNSIVGVQINFGSDENPSFEVGEPYVDPTPAYFIVRLPVYYDVPLIQKYVSYNYEVLTDEQILFKSDKDLRIDFAPKTKVGIAIPWESDTIEDGKTYTLKGSLTVGGSSFDFEKSFTYSRETSDSTSDLTGRDIPELEPKLDKDCWLWIWVLLLVILLTVIHRITSRKRSKKNSPDTVDDANLGNNLDKDDSNELGL